MIRKEPMKIKLLLPGLVIFWISMNSFAAETTIAVASNFTKTIEAIGQAFEKETGHKVKFAFGPTGKLYAQIKNGAPFDAFFGADEHRPQLTIKDGIGLKQSYFVYAQGQLALYSHDHRVDQNPIAILKAAAFNKLAIANPRTAPYGERAQTFLKQQGLYEGVQSKIVNGESIAHAFQYVVTGNAELGFVALSQLVDSQSPLYQKGYYWVLPQSDYKPINQGAVITQRGAKNKATQAFMAFMKRPQAIDIIRRFGYHLPPSNH